MNNNKTMINSPDFWEEKFHSGQWQTKKGDEHTQFYAKCLLDHLPGWILDEIKKQHLSICDWGCAEGQAVNVYSKFFAGNKICGVDVSRSAIASASNQFPGSAFYSEDWLVNSTPVKQYDVVITSHVLEHFESPFDNIALRLFEFTKNYLIMMVPFEEKEPFCKEHFYSFQYDSFPSDIGNMTCVYFDVIQPGKIGWQGSQAIAVYMKNTSETSLKLKELHEKFFCSYKNNIKKHCSDLLDSRKTLSKLKIELDSIKSSRYYRLRIIYSNIRKTRRKTRKLPSKLKQNNLHYKLRKIEQALQKFSNNNVPVLSKKTPGQQYNVACVMDTFTYSNFSNECNLKQLIPLDWKHELKSNKPDFLFIESAWRGKNELWRNRINCSKTIAGIELFQLVLWCKKRSIPTIFWCKEDPPHFEYFVRTARHFDYIFTTAVECIDDYKKHCGHDRVFPLLFAAQPKTQNPVLSVSRENKVCFAGTYHNKKYQKRTEELRMMLRAASNFGLDIYDRNYNAPTKKRRHLHFPPEFSSNILGSLDFDQMNKAYRKYRLFLNVNSVINSETMFARRVFELLACGTPVVSNYSKGIEKVFGSIVHLIQTEEQANCIFKRLLNDRQYWRQCSARGVREVMRKHTYRHRFLEILNAIGADVCTDKMPSVTVILKTEGNHELCVKMLKAQTVQPQKIIVAGGADNRTGLIADLKAAGYDAEMLQEETNLKSLQEDSENLVAIMCSKDYYGPEYIHDAIDTLAYCDTDVTTMVDFYKDENGVIAFSGDLTSECVMTNTAISSTVVAKTKILNSVLLANALNQESFKTNSPVYSRYAYEYAQLNSSAIDVDRLKEKVCL